MASQHIRNVIALLLVLTVANLGASFAALSGVHALKAEAVKRAHDADQTAQRLELVMARLCKAKPAVCADN
jgi:hypothetical protein